MKFVRPADKPEEVPGWVVSFGDMVTNLMACFVLLLSMASQQDRTLFNAGMGSYRRAVASFGLPDWLMGKGDQKPFDYVSVKYPTEEAPPEQPPTPVKDAEDEQIRQAFDNLRHQANIRSSDAREQQILCQVSPARFASGDWQLSDQARAALDAHLRTLAPLEGQATLYLVALAADEEGYDRQLSLSAKRAQAAQQYIAQRLASEGRLTKLRLCAWGAGQGSKWCQRLSSNPDNTHLIVLVTRTP